MANILRKIIENDKGEIKKLEKTAKKVESYADAMAALSDKELQAKTEEFKKRYQNGESLDQLLQLFVKGQNVSLDFSHIVCKSWVVSFFTMVTSQRCVQGKGKP